MKIETRQTQRMGLLLLSAAVLLGYAFLQPGEAQAQSTDLAVTKSVDNATPSPGGTVVYTITATNAGPDAATGVAVTDSLPAGLTYVSDDGGGAYASSVWSVGSLPAAGSATLHITATVNANTDGTTITNTALIAGAETDPNTGNNTAGAAVNVRITNLCATTGSATMPDGTIVPIWGYVPGDCTGSPAALLPNPTIVVNQGDSVTITLHNNLSEATALLFQGMSVPPDLDGAAATGGSKAYTFTAGNPGTYLYQAGLLPNAQHQTAMGLFGALIVRATTPGQAYSSSATAYDSEAVLVLSEIDPALNASPAPFDMRNYAPKYFLINGKAYPDTAGINVAAGNRVLLRYLNAGIQHHSMAALGLNQTIVAVDGSLLNYSHRVVAESIAPGQTLDAIATVPASAGDGTKYALYDGNLQLRNSSAAGMGGMLAFLAVGTPTPPGSDTTGPSTSGVTVTPAGVDMTLAASVSDVATGGSNIQAAEYFVDTVGANGAGTAMTGTFGTPSTAVSATLSAAFLATLSSGNHLVYVHGQDSAGNWGPVNFAVLNLDRTGPTTSGLTLTPNPSSGAVPVALHATGDDSTTGGANIQAAEYFVGATGADGTGTAMTVNVAAPIASLDAVIPAPVTAGTVSVHSQDANGNWGPYATIDLQVVTVGPVTSGVTAVPNPNNGSLGYNSSTPALRISASLSSSSSTIAAAEGFIDAVGPNGTGFPFLATDGAFNGAVETGYADVPLATVNALSPGSHSIYVHARDAVGNWGVTSSTTLLIDKTSPAVSGVAAAPNPTAGHVVVTLTATATDNASAISNAEWFTGADPGPGNATAMTVSGSGPFAISASINVGTWIMGDYTLGVRARDAAGNWSAVATTTLTVTVPIYFSTVGNTNPPGMGGTADDADIYRWDGTSYGRILDATALGLPAGANVDGLKFIDSTHFYLSFSGATTAVPGIGNVQDEDIVYYNNGVWSVYFDGTAAGLGASANLDIDAFDIVGGILYFSTVGNTNPPGVGGAADDADIYSWNGTSFARVWDATANGLPAGANIDGLKIIDATHFYLSFSAATTAVPVIGAVQDEDVVFFNAGTWALFFDGTAHGLGTSANLDLDAIDIVFVP